MSAPTPPVIIKAFAIAGDKNTIPEDASPTPGLASYEVGFPPLTRTPLTAGGIPPSGRDMNGVLFDVTAHLARIQGGGALLYVYDADWVAENTGYPVGAILASSANTPGAPPLYWFNTATNNATDPDDVSAAGWVGWKPTGSLYLSSTVPAGTSNNYTVGGDFNGSVNTLDLDPSGGNATVTGLTPGVEGQLVLVSNINGANNLTLAANAGGSLAANRFRMITDITLLPGMSMQIQYSVGAGSWIGIP